jgi:hypothetical protein|tara:strand:+ start:805 stop:1698 length:894 start_codon:yes stop_codon:yes gene_type:complete
METINTSCYIINFYLGDRRKTIEEYNINDRLCFLKEQIETLYQYKHSLNKIIFNFNMRERDFKYVNDLFKIIPKYIQGAEVDVNFRENIGGSYGAWNDLFETHKRKYDYYIFNEDDYFYIQDNWDDYLINKYNTLGDCGYLCMVVKEPNFTNGYRKFLAVSVGIASSENLMKIYNNKNSICTSNSNEYGKMEEVQKTFASSFLEIGLNIYDIRDEYRLAFGWTEDDGHDIHRFFWWNEKDLILPAFLRFPHSKYGFFMGLDGELTEGYIGTTVEEAIICYKDKINNWELPSYNLNRK